MADPNDPNAYDPYKKPEDTREQYTGSFNEVNETPMLGSQPAPSTTQLGSHTGPSGYIGPAPDYPGDAPGSNPTAPVNREVKAATDAANWQPGVDIFGKQMTRGEAWDAGSPFRLGGSNTNFSSLPAAQAAEQLQLQGYGASQRGPATANMGGVNMFATGAGNSLGQANGTNLLGVRQGLDLASLANGPGVAAQYGAANRLMGLSQMPAGPSVAEQQLRMGADRSLAQQLAIASGARGGNAGLALQNAGAAQGQTMGQLNEQQALLRAQEDMANRQYAASTANMAGGMYGQAVDAQGRALGGAANVFGGVAGNQVGQANAQGALANTYAGMSTADLQAAMGQRELNDRTMLASEALGNDVLNKQRDAEMTWRTNQDQLGAQRYAVDRGANLQLQLQKNASDDDMFKTILGGAIAGGGALLAPFTGGASLAAVPAGAGMMADSDIRVKTAIAPASGEVADAFRPLSSSSYFYRDPSKGEGRQYGPMAQQLEKTPAGATAVRTMPGGTKGIDTGRLALLNASATADMRRELDALKGQASQISDTETTYPAIAANNYRAEEPGNIDLTHRPYVRNRDGSVSTVRSMGANIDGREVLMPTVSDDGRIMSEREAIETYRRTGRHLGKYRSVADSNAAGQAIHEDQEREPPIATLERQNAEDETTMEKIARAQRAAELAMGRPTAYPEPAQYGGY